MAFHAGNAAMHVLQINFLEECSKNDPLPLHMAKKRVPYLSHEDALTVEPSENNAYKLEKFIFDVFPHAETVALLETTRYEFAPVKRLKGKRETGK